MTYRQLQLEMAARLADLRKIHAHNLSPEEVATRAREKNLQIGARTIRQWEAATGNPSLDALHALLSYYGIPIGEFFRFAVCTEDGRFVADVLDMARRPKMKRVLKELIQALREK